MGVMICGITRALAGAGEGKMVGEMHLEEEGRARTVTSVQLGPAAATSLTTHAGGSIALWDNRTRELASHLHLLAASGQHKPISMTS